MATLAGALTYADWAARVDDTGRIARIVELLSQTNEILDDMLVIEGNATTGHKSTVRTGLPTATWRLLNYGVPLGKSTTAPIMDTAGNLEAQSQVDVDIADLNGNTPEFRETEASAYFEGMSQQMAQTVIYGNTAVNPERFMGLSPRYNTVSLASAQTAANVLDAGGTGSDNTSIWIVTWGPRTTVGFFPKGKSGAGLQHRDEGRWRVTDSNGNYYWAYVDSYKWELGLAVPDWRYNVRVANIDVSDLATGSAANLINVLVRALYRLPTTAAGVTAVQTSDAPSIQGSMGKTVIYCNRTVRAYLDLQAMNKTNAFLTLDTTEGRVVTKFRGIPIRTVDAILNTEARIT